MNPNQPDLHKLASSRAKDSKIMTVNQLPRGNFELTSRPQPLNVDLIDYSTIVEAMSVDQLGGAELILDDQLHHEVAVSGVERVAAFAAKAIGEQDVNKVGNSCAVA